MYTIKGAAARTGLSVPVLRAWERRYGVVQPTRTAGGYRLYDDASIARLIELREMVEAGWSPANAAAHVLAAGRPVDASSPDRPVRPVPDAVAHGARLTAAAAALDVAGIDRVLDDLFAQGSFERVLTDALFPALRAVGLAWSSGRLSVAGEHLASHAVQRRLAAAFEASASMASRGRAIVVGLPPGSRHELGVLAFAIVARRAGLAVTYLGADLPLDDWVTATAQASAAVVGVPTRKDVSAARAVAERLHAARPEVLVAIGGAGAAAIEEPGTMQLPDDLETAVDRLRGAPAMRAR